MILTRRELLRRLLASAALSALPTGHVAASLTEHSEPDVISIAPGVDVIDSPAPIVAQRLVADTIYLRDEGDRFGERLLFPRSFEITAHTDGSGSIAIQNVVPVGNELVCKEAIIPLDRAAFRSVWEALFAKHYTITDSRRTRESAGINCPVTPFLRQRSHDTAAAIDRRPHELSRSRYAIEGAQEAGHDYIVIASSDATNDRDWYAVRVEATEPHWPAWIVDPEAA